jgi:quercetin dioxygenase-like cupin family protein
MPKFRSTLRHSLALLARPGVLIAALAFGGIPAQAQQGSIQATVLESVDLPGLPPGPQTFRMTMLEMQPGAKIPPHTHAGPGIRYVLEGAITIVWKDRGRQTFKAGSTYYEGAGSNHPPSEMSALNGVKGVTRVLIVELLPKE